MGSFALSRGNEASRVSHAMEDQEEKGRNPPVVSLPPQTGGAAKPLIIVGALLVLIGAGIWGLSAMGGKKENEGAPRAGVEKDKPKAKPKPKPRENAKTASRPEKSKMANLTAENLDQFAENVGKWVWLNGKVKSGNEDGLIQFEAPEGMTAQLARGSASHLTGKHLKVIAWMISERKAQVDGTFDITVLEAGDLLPDKSVYTKDDVEKLISLRNSKATFEGKVVDIRSDKEEKILVIVFEGDNPEFVAEGKEKDLKARKIDEDELKKLIGKTVRLTGTVSHKKEEEKDRISFKFRDEEDYRTVD